MKRKKSVQSRVNEKLFANVKKTELKSQRVELAIGDELKGLNSKLDSVYKSVNKEINEAFEPIRRIEKIAESIPAGINGFKEFSQSLQKMEVQYQNDVQKLKSAEQELGVKIPMPKALDSALKQLTFFQNQEQLFRDDINEFNKESKKYR